MKNISPEERLLKLIRGERKGAGAGQKECLAASFSLDRAGNSLKTFHIVKWSLFAVFFVSCAYFIFCILNPGRYAANFGLAELSGGQVFEEQSAVDSNLKSIDAYLQDIADRQIFNNSVQEEPLKQSNIIQTDVVKDINLLGIISGDNPQAILEDKNTQKTYYLNKGQSIADFVVEDIKEGKVILNYKGEKLELYM